MSKTITRCGNYSKPMLRKTNISLPRAMLRLTFSMIVITVLSGCTATKFLKEGESFYGGASIHIKPNGKIPGKGRLKTDLQTLVTPKPNKKFLGMRPGVWFYYVAGTPKKKKGFRSFIKNKLGAPPVLLSDATPDITSKSLALQVNNEGYF